LKQRIEVPNSVDTDTIASQLIHATELIEKATGCTPDGSLDDLELIQRTLPTVSPTEPYSQQSLGLVFGRLFLRNNDDFDWWMVEDEWGRDPAIRYKQTSLLLFPLTMISKRLEEGKSVDMKSMYKGLVRKVQQVASRLS
jgi:Domain of unknown function (DUF3806)